MVQVIEQGDIFGKIGKGLGEGLGESIPKSMDRHLLNKDTLALKEGVEGGTISATDLALYVPRIRGATDADKQFLYKSLSGLLASQSYQDPKDPSSTKLTPPTESTEETQPIEISESVTEETQVPLPPVTELADQKVKQLPLKPQKKRIREFGDETHSLTTPEIEKLSLQEFTELSDENIGRKARELQAKRPHLSGDFDKAYGLAEKELNAQNSMISNAQNTKKFNQTTEDGVRTAFNSKVDNVLQEFEGDKFRSIKGKGREFKVNEIIKDMNSGMSEKAAIDKALTSAIKFSKDKQQWKQVGKVALLNKPGRDYISKIRNIAKSYEEFGSMADFSNDLQEFTGMSPQLAAATIYDTSPVMNKIIEDVSKSKSKEDVEEKLFGMNKTAGFGDNFKNLTGKELEKEEKSKEVAKKLVENMTDQDSIAATQWEISSQGLNDIYFLEAVRDKQDSGELNLSSWQDDELKSLEKTQLTIGDVFNYNLMSKSFVKDGVGRKFWKKTLGANR